MKFVCILALVGLAVAAPNKFIPRTGKEWTPASLVNPDELGDYFEGDIEGPLPGILKNGLIDEKYRWDNGIVHYKFSSHFAEEKRDIVRAAMDEYKDLTNGCITFVERTDEKDYVYFTQDNDHGCHSKVGKVGGSQEINYPDWCLKKHGSILHEMYHALGFHHEQSRTDRDDYVTIMWDNIESGHEHNFNKYSADVVSGFGENYDYGSVMHYSAHAFSENGEKTIVTKDPDAEIGQRIKLSDVDLRKLMNMYKC
ncbi:zinc metalloproteinase nas-4-like [Homarus americanus]|uniref:Zinc metalloproteinase nas-4-like 2 n=1 Tax=Homarus americanus TaxID=6706 RepID=A0A8J5JZZ6_HOMAM|nr:zinc metalloproteinase nas-4-like [Homarus americanus]KAG7167112.1 Zinc metalloproteinase nas-4-like 2 [Homarus americanus]